MDPDHRIGRLRAALSQRQLAAAVILTSDPHLSEYIPEYWQVRQWLTGFDGSAGTLVVTADFAGLWVDSRYWEQAELDLAGTGIAVMQLGSHDVPDPDSWLAQNLAAGQRVWLDFRTLSVQAHQRLSRSLDKAGMELVGQPDLIDSIWPDRPALPAQAVYAHMPPYACRTRAGNLQAVRDAMAQHGAQWHVLSSLDDIAWLFNLRGSDVPYNPVFLAHAIIGAENARLFIAPDKISPDLVRQLRDDAITVLDYQDFDDAVAALPASDTVLFDPARMAMAAWQRFRHLDQVSRLNPSQLLKACKNDAEIENVRRTMEYDGAALCEFFAWFETALGRETITELTVDERLTQARARQPGFVSPSFGTIAAFNANGAMPHYQATPDRHAEITADGLLLIDSGGQYLGGTTDITRVVPTGKVTDAQRHDFTVVLKGMIALSQAHFPQGTPGPMIDAIARAPLWQAGVDFGHGTGHGVGYFMNVHEGPQSISPRARISPDMAMRPGMITSNEPGLYRPGQWGIRIENLVLTVPAGKTPFGEFLKFETLTLCPIDTRCIDPAMLTRSEADWLDAYHRHVRDRLLPLTAGAAREWLVERTQPLGGQAAS